MRHQRAFFPSAVAKPRRRKPQLPEIWRPYRRKFLVPRWARRIWGFAWQTRFRRQLIGLMLGAFVLSLAVLIQFGNPHKGGPEQMQSMVPEWVKHPTIMPEDVTIKSADSEGTGDMSHANFGLCHTGGGRNCVVDGDTFWLNGQKIRVADIDTPETHPARCPGEAALGDAATRRLQELLNAGDFSLRSVDRDRDRYGRLLRVVERDGQSLGDMLIAEGLARPYAGGIRAGWCP